MGKKPQEPMAVSIEDAQFLIEQLYIIEPYQDHDRIKSIAKKYNLTRW